MNTELKIITTATGATATYTLREAPDWTVLVNRLITKRFGTTAARDRQEISSTEFPVRAWAGIINGHTYEIVEEVVHPVLVAASEAADAVRTATENLAAAQAARDEVVRAALESGQPIKKLAVAAGVTKARVYQIRDHRR